MEINMTKIKLCGLSRPCDIETVNRLMPDYIGFVFAPKSKRYIPPQTAEKLKDMLDPRIQAAGVFVNEDPGVVADLLNSGIIDIAQLHGSEDPDYAARLRRLTKKKLFRAFKISKPEDIETVRTFPADQILLDAGAGTGTVFDWNLIKDVERPYFLAGGLNCENVADAIKTLKPYGVDVSSGIETDGLKDSARMAAFVVAVRAADTEVTL